MRPDRVGQPHHNLSRSGSRTLSDLTEVALAAIAGGLSAVASTLSVTELLEKLPT